VQEAPDVIFRTYAAGSTGTVSGSSVVIVTDDGAASRYFSGLIVGEPHRLVTDLNWQGLVAQESLGLQLRETDEPLLRQGSRVLAFVRRQDKVPQLFINFDVAKSNASRLPALVLLVHRFVEDLRAEKVGWERSNVELSQPLTVAAKTNEPLVLEEKNTKHSEAVASGGVRAPSHPSFFTIKQGKEVLMEGAATFAEVREADFRSAESVVSLESVVQVAQRRNVQADPLAAWWVLGLLALLLTVWGWSARGSS
jgi:hypothetical protein